MSRAASVSPRRALELLDRGVDRFAERLGGPSGAGAAGLRAFRTLLLVHAAVRVWDRARHEELAVFLGGAAALLTAAAALSATRWAREAVWIGLWVLAVEWVLTPAVANHVHLELACVALFALLDVADDAERGLLLASLRWVGVVVFFAAGLQKLLYGTYFRGELLTWMIAQRPPFAALFGFLLPADELARLTALDGASVGSGPYRTSAPLLLALSNAVWIAELALPPLMLWRRTRVAAALAAALFVLAIQLGARETLFALLFSQLCLLLLPGEGYRRLAPVYVLAYLYLAAFLLGLAPGGLLVRHGEL